MFWTLLLVLLIVLFVAARSSPSTVAGIVNRLGERIAAVFSGVKEDLEDLDAEWRGVARQRAARKAAEKKPRDEGTGGAREE